METNVRNAGPFIIRWRPHYSVGHRELDEQHRQIISLVSHLEEAVAGEDKDTIPTLTRHLAECTRAHFRDEERMMGESGFPGCQEHRETHRRLMGEDYDLELRALEDPSRARGAITFLKHWWITHIVGDDMAYAPYLQPLTTRPARRPPRPGPPEG